MRDLWVDSCETVLARVKSCRSRSKMFLFSSELVLHKDSKTIPRLAKQFGISTKSMTFLVSALITLTGLAIIVGIGCVPSCVQCGCVCARVCAGAAYSFCGDSAFVHSLICFFDLLIVVKVSPLLRCTDAENTP